MITGGSDVSHDLAHREALPLVAVPPRWVDELLGTAVSRDACHGDIHIRTSGPAAHATTCIYDAVHLEAQALREKVAAAYRAIIGSLAEMSRHPARFWNFIPDIGAPMADGLDRYMVFNAGRHDAFKDQHGSLGTASAVGIKGSDLSIHCLALDRTGAAVENPRQIPAWQYSSRYGPLPPCFSRATRVVLYGRPMLLIGGTASVVGEDSRHPGQFDAQVKETLLNLDALIRAANASRGEVSVPLHNLVDLRVYVTSPAEADRVREMLVASCPRARTIAVAIAQVCRPELLVEIEGVAEL
jgi:chorismate lyase/3-hydroxybenzoate synthase